MGRIVGVVLLVGLSLFPVPAPAADPPALLILPFEISSQERLEYIQESLVDLLASRLGQSPDITLVDPRKVRNALRQRAAGPLSDEDAQALARTLGADYLLAGRFTKLGEAFSLDAAVVDVRDGRVVTRASAEGEGVARLIPKVGELAESLRRRVAGLPKGGAPPAVGRATPPSPAPPGAAARPEVAAKPGGGGEAGTPAPGRAWVSRPLPLEIRGIAVGDVNQDGANEIVVVASHEVQLHRWDGRDLTLVTRYAAGGLFDLVGVDVADLNGNGRPEIYVTALGPGQSLASFVLEWDGAALRPIASRLPWYFRLVRLPEGPTLAGQARGYRKVFDGPVRRLSWRGPELVAGDPLALPGHVTVYSFAVADLDRDGQPEVASLQPETPLTLYSPQGRVLAAGYQYGQTAVYVVEVPSRDGDPEACVHLPGRLLAVELPGQGPRLLAARNHETLGVFQRARLFSSGAVVALRWENESLDEVWQTDDVRYVADFQVAALGPTGAPFLVLGNVTDFAGLLTSPRSRLVLVPLDGVGRQ